MIEQYNNRAPATAKAPRWARWAQVLLGGWLLLPGFAAALSLTAPQQSSGNYTVSWPVPSHWPYPGDPNYVQIQERQGTGGAWINVYSGQASSKSFNKSTAGTWFYRGRTCTYEAEQQLHICYPQNWQDAIEIQVEVQITPTTPGGLGDGVDPILDTGDYSLSWNASTGTVKRYQLQEQSQGGSWSTVHNSTGRTKSFSGKADGIYAYRVRACSDVACSSYTSSSSPKTVTVLKIPSVPGNLSLQESNFTDGNVTLSWAPSQETVASYVIQRRQGDGEFQFLDSVDTTSYPFSSHPDGTYTYRVQACNVSGCSDFSSTATIEVLRIPQAPSHLILDAVSHSGRYTVAWPASADSSVAQYQLEKKIGAGEWQALVFGGDVLQAEESHMQNGSLAYRVRACNASGCSPYSAEASITVELRFEDVIPDAEVEQLPVPMSDNVGSLPGAGGVSGGSAQYSIQLPMPPGRAGMQPAVSLSYNHGGGDGILGVGWSLDAGQGSVHRCARIEAIHGENRPPELSLNDALCWNGQPLFRAYGSYGQVGSEYRTEINNFAKVELKGGSINNASSSWFEVTHKSGRVERYEARNVHGEGQSAVPFSWHLSRATDTHGNRIDYLYSNINEELLLQEIRYTGFGEQMGNRSVYFTYVDRGYLSESYYRGKRSQASKRLKSIQAIVPGEPTTWFHLDYQSFGSGATRRNLLESVQHCAEESCLGDFYRRTRFEYNDQPITHERIFYQAQDPGEYIHAFKTSDYDGDGVLDEAVSTCTLPDEDYQWTCSTKWYASSTGEEFDLIGLWDALGQEDGWEDQVSLWIGHYGDRPSRDFSRDGMQELLGRVNGKFATATLDLLGGTLSPIRVSNLDVSGSPQYGDYNRDGRPDLVVWYGANGRDGDGIMRRIHLQTSVGVGNLQFDVQGIPLPNWGDEGVVDGVPKWLQQGPIMDLNGDGLPDILLVANTGRFSHVPTRVLMARMDNGVLSYGESILFSELGGEYKVTGPSRYLFIDVNGDGLPDILKLSEWSATPSLWINQGGTFEEVAVVGPDLRDPDARFWQRILNSFVMDYDNDGRVDLMVPTELTHNYCYLMKNDDESEIHAHCSNGNDTLIDVGMDKGIYRFDQVSFQPQADGSSYRLIRQPTPLETMVNETRVGDWNGDGLQDVYYTARHAYAPVGPPKSCPQGPCPREHIIVGHAVVPPGTHVILNTHGADGDFGIDQLRKVTDGLGAVNEWRYGPLSGSGSASCSYSAERPFYAIDRDAAKPGHFHFGSSMLVATEHRQSNGVGGMNSHCYRYEDAMYSVNGRGFDGFRAISVDENFVDTANNKTTRTLFHDEFPLNGRHYRTEVRLMSDAPDRTPISRTETTWEIHSEQAGTQYTQFIYPSLERTDSYDLFTRQLMSSVRKFTRYDAGNDRSYGNPSYSYTRHDTYFGGQLALRDLSEHYNYYTYDRVDDWWLDKLERTVSIAKPTQYFGAADGPWPDAEANSEKRVEQHYSWWSGDKRQLEMILTQPGVPGEESYQAFGYDNYGNQNRVSLGAPGVEERTTLTTWTLGGQHPGYFPERVSVVVDVNSGISHVSRATYDPKWGLPLTQTSPQGVVTRYTYLPLGQLRKTSVDGGGAPDVHQALRHCSHAIPCPEGAVTRATTVSDGAPVSHSYLDLLGRTVGTRSSGFGSNPDTVTLAEYDHRGNLLRESLPALEGETLYFTVYDGHDALGRPMAKTVDRSGHAMPSQTWLYEHSGLETTIHLPDGQLNAARRYDARGNLYSTTDTAGSETHFRYNGLGKQVLMEDVAGNQVRTYHDALGRAIRIEDPNTGGDGRPSQLLVYNGLGETEVVADANGDTLTYRYDTLGRKTQRLVNGVPDAFWEYDQQAPGTLSVARLANGGYRQSIDYDQLARPVKSTVEIDGTHTFVTESAYDTYYGRLKGMRYPSGELLAYAHDKHGFVVAEYDPLAADPDAFYHRVDEVDAAGKVRQATFGNGLVGQYDYYASSGQAQRLRVQGYPQPQGPVVDMLYRYDDPFGNLTRRENAAKGVAEDFTFDGLQRLVNVQRTWSGTGVPAPLTVDYEYDAIGNLTVKSDFGLAYSYGNTERTAGGNAGPHAVNAVQLAGGGWLQDFAYDHNGNMLAGNGRSTEYDVFNKPTRITNGGASTHFHYDPELQLYKRVEPERTVYYAGSGYQLVLEEGRQIQRTFVSGNVVVEQDGASRKVRYQHHDLLGSVVAVTDEAGHITEEHGFDVFGKPLEADWSDNGGLLHSGINNLEQLTEMGFTGHEHMDLHKVIHMKGRVYDPALGRFMSPDPIIQAKANSQSQNPYSYIMNNPLAGTDPSGYCAQLPNTQICAGEIYRVESMTPKTGSHLPHNEATFVATLGENGAINVTFNNLSPSQMAEVKAWVMENGGSNQTPVTTPETGRDDQTRSRASARDDRKWEDLSPSEQRKHKQRMLRGSLGVGGWILFPGQKAKDVRDDVSFLLGKEPNTKHDHLIDAAEALYAAFTPAKASILLGVVDTASKVEVILASDTSESEKKGAAIGIVGNVIGFIPAAKTMVRENHVAATIRAGDEAAGAVYRSAIQHAVKDPTAMSVGFESAARVRANWDVIVSRAKDTLSQGQAGRQAMESAGAGVSAIGATMAYEKD